MNSQIVTVNLVPGLSAPAVVKVSQYDVGRPLTLRVFDGTGTASFGASVTATIVGTKPSGLGFTETGTIAGNTVTLNTTLAMTQERGMIPAEIRFVQTGENIGTANFILAVEPSPHPDGTTDGTSETIADVLTQCATYAESAEEDATAAANSATAAAASAESISQAGIDASTATFGQVVVADGEDAWEWKSLGYVTPEMFGAVGDGLADDTDAVASAFQYPVVLLENTYLTDSTITSDVKYVFGGGKIKSTASFLVCNSDVVIRDIEIEQANDGTSIGITCKGNCVIDNVKISNGLKGIQVNNNYKKCWVTNCTFSGMYGDVARGFENLLAGASYFANNTIENISNNLDRDADGVHFWQGETANYPCVIIKGNVFHNCRGRAIKASTSNVLVEGNNINIDNDFSVITNSVNIDIQKGNSVVRQNYINAPGYGIQVSVRYFNSSHSISDNILILASGTKASIYISSVDSAYNSNVEILHNTIYGANAISILTSFLTNGRYVIKNNKVYGRTSNTPMATYGTADTSCRFIVLDNINVDGVYFFEFTDLLNVYGDATVRLKTTKPTIANLLFNTRFVANSENINGTNGNCLMETKGYSQNAYSVYMYSDYCSVYDKYGNRVI